MSASPFGPYAGSTNDCVATAPTPASAQVTTDPTENQWLCTATPMSPVAGSRATMEKVATGMDGFATDDAAAGHGDASAISGAIIGRSRPRAITGFPRRTPAWGRGSTGRSAGDRPDPRDAQD